MSCLNFRGGLLAGFLSIIAAGPAPAVENTPASAPLETLLLVGKEGHGNRAAAPAWRQLTACDARSLPEILAALDGAGPLPANWIRSAADAIAERAIKEPSGLPVAELKTFLADTKHDARARRWALEWIERVEPAATEKLVASMLDDPSPEIRFDAVGRLLTEAEKLSGEKKTDEALAVYDKALAAARHPDQVKVASDVLKKAGRDVDLARHFGFIVDWSLIGPFDNVGRKGFSAVYPPEKNIDLAATYPGKATPAKDNVPAKENEAKWSEHRTTDEYGQVDLNKAIREEKGVVAYALATFVSEQPREIELRLGSECANKIWLNGELVHSVEVYHSFTRMDQYITRAKLQAGRNQILVKICQNEQTESWAVDWKFQLRVCDASGAPLLSQDRAAGDKKTAQLNRAEGTR